MSQSKIVRRPDFAGGGITPAEREKMKDVSRLWTERGYRTEPIDPDKITPAIKALYATAGLKEPRVIIVPSPLCMALAGGFSAAIWHLRKHDATDDATDDATERATARATRDATDHATSRATDHATARATELATRATTELATSRATRGATARATRDATELATELATRAATRAATARATELATYDVTSRATADATRAATRDATELATELATSRATSRATRAATRDVTFRATDHATARATELATYDATELATRAATELATRAATELATRDVTDHATDRATDRATDDATELATNETVLFMLKCAQNWRRMYQGGNMWVAWPAYLSAARDVLGLRLPEHAKYKAWEDSAIEGGGRIMHEEFCIVSDFPVHIKTDAENRAHCGDGPSHLWRDGWSIYSIHGVQVPEYVVMRPHEITAGMVDEQDNIEVKRVMIERMGVNNYVAQSEFRVIDEGGDNHPVMGLRGARLLQRQMDTHDAPLTVIECINSSPEPDGSYRKYHLSVNPRHYNGEAGKNVLAAMASTWRDPLDKTKLFFDAPEDYCPLMET